MKMTPGRTRKGASTSAAPPPRPGWPWVSANSGHHRNDGWEWPTAPQPREA
uniref:Uncharacterized protein n=1 Tax=Arundo donax TaxID=35708 RepID=A0A0A9GLP0_ARUDO